MEEKFSPKNTKVADFIKAKLETENTKRRLKDLVISIIITIIAYFPIKAAIPPLSENIITFIVIFLFWAWIYFVLRFKTQKK